MDYSLFGHQIVCHEVKDYNAASIHNAVDGDPVPVPHFGLALTVQQFHSLAGKVKDSGIDFVLDPHLRFQGKDSGHLHTLPFDIYGLLELMRVVTQVNMPLQ